MNLKILLNQALDSACCQQTRKFHESCYEILFDKVYKIAYGYSKTDAKDLTHDIFLKIFGLDINKLKPHADYIESYLLGIARNYCKTYYSKKKKTMENALAYQSGDKSYISSSYEMDLDNILKTISENQAEAIKMKSQGFSNKEIAKLLGSSEGAIKNRIHYGRKNIQKNFKEYKPPKSK